MWNGWNGRTPSCGTYDQYKQVTFPATLPIDLAFVKSYLRIDDSTDDALITMLIQVVASFIENYTGRTLINTQFLTYRDNFDCCCGITLKRSQFVSLDEFTYKNTLNVVTIVDPSWYYLTDETDYSSILKFPIQQWPSDILCVRQAVKILFTAGYGATADTIPVELKEVILQLVADMYFNRGDCVSAGKVSCSCQRYLNAASAALLNQYRILTI